jgi:hypothetical protein
MCLAPWNLAHAEHAEHAEPRGGWQPQGSRHMAPCSCPIWGLSLHPHFVSRAGALPNVPLFWGHAPLCCAASRACRARCTPWSRPPWPWQAPATCSCPPTPSARFSGEPPHSTGWTWCLQRSPLVCFVARCSRHVTTPCVCLGSAAVGLSSSLRGAAGGVLLDTRGVPRCGNEPQQGTWKGFRRRRNAC